MSYQLEYGLQSIKINKGFKRNKYLCYFLKLTLLIVCVVSIHLFSMLFHFVILGPSEITKTAADQMVENLRSGESLYEAIQTFCRTISE